MPKQPKARRTSILVTAKSGIASIVAYIKYFLRSVSPGRHSDHIADSTEPLCDNLSRNIINVLLLATLRFHGQALNEPVQGLNCVSNPVVGIRLLFEEPQAPRQPRQINHGGIPHGLKRANRNANTGTIVAFRNRSLTSRSSRGS
jgi:hypothetical protein